MAEVPHDQMPQSIEECVIGLEQAEKYEKLMFEGPLTQQGADCPVCDPFLFACHVALKIRVIDVATPADAFARLENDRL